MHNLNLYEENSNPLALEQFVIMHRTLVRNISLGIKKRLPPSVEFDDILQSGLVGLLEARKNFKQSMGTNFEAYASIRIKGAIIDSLRKSSWVNRETVKNMRRVADAIKKIEQRDQQPASAEKIAMELEMTLDDYFHISQEISVCQVVSLDEMDGEYFIPSEHQNNPQEVAQQDDLKVHLKTILSTLPERDQQLLSLYYIDEFSFKQIGEIFDLTEARISQLHSKLIQQIRAKIKREIEA